MGIVEYFKGRRIVLHSPLRPAEVGERINASCSSRFNPFAAGVKGGVFANRMNLFDAQWGMFSYNAMPVLVGKLTDTPAGCTIEATYRAPLWVYAFFLIWYGLLMLFMLLTIAGASAGGLEPGGWIIFLILPLFALVPIAMHYGFSSSEASLDRILHLLETKADLTRLV